MRHCLFVVGALLAFAVDTAGLPARAATTREVLASQVERDLAAQFLERSRAAAPTEKHILRARARKLASAVLDLPEDSVDDSVAKWLHDSIMVFCGLGNWAVASNTHDGAKEAEFLQQQFRKRLKTMTSAEAKRLRTIAGRTWAGQRAFTVDLRNFVISRLSEPSTLIIDFDAMAEHQPQMKAVLDVAGCVGYGSVSHGGSPSVEPVRGRLASRAVVGALASLVSRLMDGRAPSFDIFSPAFDPSFPVQPDAYLTFNQVHPSIEKAWQKCVCVSGHSATVDVEALTRFIFVASFDRFPQADQQVTAFSVAPVWGGVSLKVANSPDIWASVQQQAEASQ